MGAWSHYDAPASLIMVKEWITSRISLPFDKLRVRKSTKPLILSPSKDERAIQSRTISLYAR